MWTDGVPKVSTAKQKPLKSSKKRCTTCPWTHRAIPRPNSHQVSNPTFTKSLNEPTNTCGRFCISTNHMLYLQQCTTTKATSHF